jgi:hypothetical protein
VPLSKVGEKGVGVREAQLAVIVADPQERMLLSRYPLGEGDGAVLEIADHEVVDQSPRQSLDRGNALPGGHHFQGVFDPHHARETLRSASAGK